MTEPDIVGVPGPVTLKVVALIVVTSIGTLNVALTVVLSATPMAPLDGTVDTTVGGGAVVKVHTELAVREAPVGSVAPVVIVAVNKVLLGRTTAGVNVAVLPA